MSWEAECLDQDPATDPTTEGRPSALGNAAHSASVTRPSAVGNAVRSTAVTRIVHGSRSALTRKVAICPLVFGLDGQ